MISAKEADWLMVTADRVAIRLWRQGYACQLDREDIRQDLLVDVLSRLQRFDPRRSPFRAFVVLCIAHRSALILRSAVRESAARHPVDLDGPSVSGSTVRVVETLDESAGYGSWIGQPTDRLLELERHLDLDRALSGLAADVVPLCAALVRDGTAPAGARVSRSTLHRRKHDLRCQLLTAGLGGEREQLPRSVNR